MIDFGTSTALVTGASKGLGAAFAHALANRGSNLVLVARSRIPLTELARQLSRRYGVRCISLPVDLAEPDAVQRVVAALDAQRINIDLLVNNAGLGLPGLFLGHDLQRELATIQVNVQALVGLTHALGTRMVKRERGGIINLSSNAAFLPLPSMATYGAAKAFVQHFSEALEYELRGSGVHVMAVVPGPTATSFFDGVKTQLDSADLDDPEDVARNALRDFQKWRTVSYPGRIKVRLGTLIPRLLSRDTTVRMAYAETEKMGIAY